MTDGINTLRYSDFFLAMYFDGGKSCLHRNHSHVLVYMYSGEMVIDERGKTTRLHKGDCAFIRKDFSVQMTKQAWNGEQFFVKTCCALRLQPHPQENAGSGMFRGGKRRLWGDVSVFPPGL